MVNHLNTEDAPCLDHCSREVDVVRAWFRVSGGVVMREEYGGGAGRDGWSEHFAGLHRHMSHGPDRNGLNRDQAEPDIQQHDSQRLGIKASELGQVSKSLGGSSDRLG